MKKSKWKGGSSKNAKKEDTEHTGTSEKYAAGFDS
jgi:hypothetical protein